MKLGDLVGATAKRFAAAKLHYGHGTDNARDEAAYLVLRALDLPFHADARIPVNDADLRRVEKLVERRIHKRIPTAYLLKEAWLDGLPFYVDRRVIVPRSHIAGLLHSWPGRVRRVLDLCAGSACLAVLAARAFPLAKIDAADISEASLAVAERNRQLHGLGHRMELVRSDLFAGLRGRRYDLILTNPPYVPRSVMRRLPREYRYEPGLALGAGEDGLDLVARILAAAPEHLRPGGALVCEIGDNRRALEQRYPRLPVNWPLPEVFLYRPRSAGASRTRAKRARVP
ncbi:MAG TPA: 50S ribosomal protein L3 N(5)-glutamine methyltransferase [Burkholderiales bacterium]|nr:50S ribosomal protein L3 N(5)-glutamine methyltransferase [Burkholderiales bacterium]